VFFTCVYRVFDLSKNCHADDGLDVTGDCAMKLEIAAELFPEGSVIVAHAKGLDVASCGKTQNEAVRSLMEALRLFLTVSQDRGTLEQILIESGFVREGDLWLMPTDEKEGWTLDNMLPLHQITRQVACVEI
jgi:hypothetical protein